MGRRKKVRVQTEQIKAPVKDSTRRQQVGTMCKSCGGTMRALRSVVVNRGYPSFLAQQGHTNVIQRCRYYKCDQCNRTAHAIVETPESL